MFGASGVDFFYLFIFCITFRVAVQSVFLTLQSAVMAMESMKLTELRSRTKQWVCVDVWAEEGDDDEEEVAWTTAGFSFWPRLTLCGEEKLHEEIYFITFQAGIKAQRHTHISSIHTPRILSSTGAATEPCVHILMAFMWKECTLHGEDELWGRSSSGLIYSPNYIINPSL